MRVLYFTRDYTTHDYRFLTALAGSPHETYFLRLEDDGFDDESRPLPEGVREVHWAGGRKPAPSVADWMRLLPDFERVLEKVRPDVVHAGPVPSCGYIAALSGFRPLLTMSWGSDLLIEAPASPSLGFTARFALRQADALVCDCDAVREQGRRLSGRDDLFVVQFPWGVDLQVFSPAADRRALRCEMGLDDAFVVLSTRRWEPGYDIETLIESVRLARRHVRSVRLLLLGDGSLRDRVRSLLRSAGLEGTVMTPGHVPYAELAKYFQAADLYVSCATSDGSSISLLEAMACGLPVVLGDTPGNREWITDPAGGSLVPLGQAPAFSDAVIRFAQAGDAALRKAGQVNRQVAGRRADWSLNVQRLFDAYARVFAARTTGPIPVARTY